MTMKRLFAAIIAAQLLIVFPDTFSIHAQTAVESSPPPLSLFEAVKLTEEYNAKHKLKPFPQFLSSVRYIVPGQSGSGQFGDMPYWEVAYTLTHPMPAGAQLFYVSIKREVKFVPSE